MSIKTLKKVLKEAAENLSTDTSPEDFEQSDDTVLTGGKAKYKLDLPETGTDVEALKLGLKTKRASISNTPE